MVDKSGLTIQSMGEQRMALIEWMDVFSVGNPEMDKDHQALLDLLNRAYEAWVGGEGTADVREVFDELFSYTEHHFSREETLLIAAGYAGLERQQQGHAALLSQLKAFQEQHLSGQERSTLTDEMLEFLRSWMINHILEEDMKYRSVLANFRQA